jgi:hypothetical protein
LTSHDAPATPPVITHPTPPNAAVAACDAIATLTCLTVYADAYIAPADVRAVLATLAELTAQLPVALTQAAQWLEGEALSGRLAHAHADPPAAAAVAVSAVLELRDVVEQAGDCALAAAMLLTDAGELAGNLRSRNPMTEPRTAPEVPAVWPCSAYGAEGLGIGALCFLAATGERLCQDPHVCAAVMGAERRRVFARIHELAAAGDADAAYLAAEFSSPDQLLNADPGGTPPAQDPAQDRRADQSSGPA